MKRLLQSIVATTALCASSATFAADPIYGVWVRDGHPTDKLEFFDCSGKLCAKGVLPMLDGSPAPQILRSAAKTAPNSWTGDLFNPEDGKTYSGKITYDSPTQLTLTGCLMGFLCQSETWTRVSGPPKAAAPAEAKSAVKAEAKGDAKSDDKGRDAVRATAAEPAKSSEKGPGAKAAGGQDAAKSAKPVKPAEAKPAAPKTAPARPKAPDSEAD